MKRYLITILLAGALLAPVTIQAQKHRHHPQVVNPTTVPDSSGIVAYSDTTSTDTAGTSTPVYIDEYDDDDDFFMSPSDMKDLDLDPPHRSGPLHLRWLYHLPDLQEQASALPVGREGHGKRTTDPTGTGAHRTSERRVSLEERHQERVLRYRFGYPVQMFRSRSAYRNRLARCPLWCRPGRDFQDFIP